MNQEEIIVQISTGGYQEHKAGAGEICRRLDALFSIMKVKKVIIGWSCSREVYQDVLAFLKEREQECYLWLPVFSETGVLNSQVGRLVDYKGGEAASYGLSQGENFEFYCPNQKKNRDAFLSLYEEQFGDLEFDGVFLDKIRFSSCANGLGGIFNCFCPDCLKFYESQGLDSEILRREMDRVSRGTSGYGGRVLGIRSYENGAYVFDNPVWKHFFRAKAEAVAQAMEEITCFFKKRSMKVGMDTFVPYLAYFSGQDMEKLSSMADFIKPMMYRITHAPAGLPFETKRLIEETVQGDRKRAGEKLCRTLGCKEGETPWQDMDFIKRELEYANSFGTPVYCGFECNKNQAADAGPEYIEETIRCLRDAPVQGYVLSWDLMSAPEQNIRAVAACIGKGRA